MNEWIVIIFSAGVVLAAVAVRQLLQWVRYTQHLEAKAAHYERLALTEHMAAQNLVEAVRREDWNAARTIVSAWSTS